MSIGQNLRTLRKVKNLTLRQLSDISGLSTALLSQIERGNANPSVNSLRKLADSLGTAVRYFFDDGTDNAFVTRKDARKILEMGSGVSIHLLSQQTAPSLEVLLNTYEVNACTGDDLYTHNGEEFAIVLEGTLQVELGSEIIILEAGDCISYGSTIPHRISNIGSTPAKAIWVNTPPRNVGAR